MRDSYICGCMSYFYTYHFLIHVDMSVCLFHICICRFLNICVYVLNSVDVPLIFIQDYHDYVCTTSG